MHRSRWGRTARHDCGRGLETAVREFEDERLVQRDQDLHGMVRVQIGVASGAAIEDGAGCQREHPRPTRTGRRSRLRRHGSLPVPAAMPRSS